MAHVWIYIRPPYQHINQSWETPWVKPYVNSTKWLNETQSTWHMNAALRTILKTLFAKLLLFQSHWIVAILGNYCLIFNHLKSDRKEERAREREAVRLNGRDRDETSGFLKCAISWGKYNKINHFYQLFSLWSCFTEALSLRNIKLCHKCSWKCLYVISVWAFYRPAKSSVILFIYFAHELK